MMPDNTPFISVIIPVRNEAKVLERCLLSLKKLHYPPDKYEIIIADGMSSDNSGEIARGYGAKVIRNEGQTATSGRNKGFMHSRGDIIAFTDADCVFDRNWLKNSIKYLADIRVAGVSGITAFPEKSTAFEKAVNFLFDIVAMASYTAHVQKVSRVYEAKDLPGCNAIYRRDALKKVMPIDEDLLTAEDVWLNHLLTKLNYKLLLAPDIKLWHYRRSTPKKFIRQIYRYAIARLQAGRKSAFKLINPLHLLTGLGLPIFIIAGIVSYLAGGLIYFLWMIFIFLAILSAIALIKTKNVLVSLNVPLVMIFFVFSWSAGFLREWFSPLRIGAAEPVFNKTDIKEKSSQ